MDPIVNSGDRIVKQMDHLEIHRSNMSLKLKIMQYFFVVVVAMCIVFAVMIIRYADTVYYLVIPFLPIYPKMYFSHIKRSKAWERKLYVSDGMIEYNAYGDLYNIPIVNISAVEDHAVYYDIGHPSEHHWDHKFTIQVKDYYYMKKYGSVEEAKRIKLDASERKDIMVLYLVLSHEEYKRVIAYIREKVASKV